MKLVALAKELGLDLRQTYARKAPRLVVQIGRYAHARQFKRMRIPAVCLSGSLNSTLIPYRDIVAQCPHQDGKHGQVPRRRT